jgi:hypothetical protein
VKLDIKYKAQWVKYFPLVVRHPQPQGTTFQGTQISTTHPPKKFPTYVALMSSIIDTEPSSSEEAAEEQI